MRTHKKSILRVVYFLSSIMLLFSLVLPAGAQSSVTLQVHGVRVEPSAASPTYDVSIGLSLLDSAGNPIKNATEQDFSLLEDNKPVKIDSLEATTEPINVAVVLDTSGSMVGEKIKAARSAASRFIEDLQSSDQVAVLTFDTTVEPRIDFTTDHAAARQQVDLVEYTPGGGTCLYDAAYETIQQTAALPTGRRAVILLTDGKDEVDEKPCSHYTVEDVIALATKADALVPIYIIGLGRDVDAQVLERIASQTGGRYQASPETTQLEALFGRISDELRSQYEMKYTSSAEPGNHTLIVQVDYRGAKDEVSVTAYMPALPYSISFTAPVDGGVIDEKSTLQVSISGQGAPIAKVIFLANNEPIGSVTEAPYELEWDPAGLEMGDILLEAIAQDANGVELARSGVTITLQEKRLTTPTPEGPITKKPSLQMTNNYLIIAAVLGLLLAGIIIAVVVFARKRKDEKQRDKEWKEKVEGTGGDQSSSGMDDRTMDSFDFEPSAGALGMLVVLESDDPSLRGQRYEINKAATKLGRKSTNDIMFPKDGPVSREHAVIEERGGQLYLSEVMAADESGQPKRPSYGTFVNNQQVEGTVGLRNGDEIRLGKRVRLKFESLGDTLPDSDRTIDQFEDSDKTMDG